MNDKEFLKWIWYRLYQVHGEDVLTDYMTKLWSIIEDYDPKKITPNTKTKELREEDERNSGL